MDPGDDTLHPTTFHVRLARGVCVVGVAAACLVVVLAAEAAHAASPFGPDLSHLSDVGPSDPHPSGEVRHVDEGSDRRHEFADPGATLVDLANAGPVATPWVSVPAEGLVSALHPGTQSGRGPPDPKL